MYSRRHRLRRRSQRQTSQPSPAARPRAISCRLEIRRRRVRAGQRFRQHRQSRRAASQDFFKSVVSAVRTQSACSAANEPLQRNSFARMNFHGRSQFAILYRWRDEAFPETIKPWTPDPPLGPSALDSNDAQRKEPSPGMPFRKDCNRKDDERTNRPPAAPRRQLEPGSLIPAAIC